jgi:hypothetical protein
MIVSNPLNPSHLGRGAEARDGDWQESTADIFPASPFTQKVRLALKLKQIPYSERPSFPRKN